MVEVQDFMKTTHYLKENENSLYLIIPIIVIPQMKKWNSKDHNM